MEIEKKIRHLKTTTEAVIVGALSMIKKGTDKHINKISSSSRLYEIQKKSTLWNCSFQESTINWVKIVTTKRGNKNIYIYI